MWCEPGGFCVAVDRPAARCSRACPRRRPRRCAAVVRDTSATLAGVVNPNDAVLGACMFEYGTGGPYTQMVPCSVLPAPVGGAQVVGAEIGLARPNTTYHYRLLASRPPARARVSTSPSRQLSSSGVPLVYPHPSISGTPAVGQSADLPLRDQLGR